VEVIIEGIDPCPDHSFTVRTPEGLITEELEPIAMTFLRVAHEATSDEILEDG